jgi:hypothetical protein
MLGTVVALLRLEVLVELVELVALAVRLVVLILEA